MTDFVVNRPLQPGDRMQTREQMLWSMTARECPMSRDGKHHRFPWWNGKGLACRHCHKTWPMDRCNGTGKIEEKKDVSE